MREFSVQMDKMKNQSLEKIEQLSKIELSLFEREVEVDNKMAWLNRREQELKSRQERQREASVQTDMSFFESVIKREAALAWRESRAHSKAFHFEERLRELGARRAELEAEYAQKKDQLVSQALELERREARIAERLEDAFCQPLKVVKSTEQNISSHLQALTNF